jgi:hypothetical protein
MFLLAEGQSDSPNVARKMNKKVWRKNDTCVTCGNQEVVQHLSPPELQKIAGWQPELAPCAAIGLNGCRIANCAAILLTLVKGRGRADV